MVDKDLRKYIEENIIPLYDGFDDAHQRVHVETVIRQSEALMRFFPGVNENMVYTIAAYHDTGLQFGREMHHVYSAKIVREDRALCRWFTEEQIGIMAEAVEDHRASGKGEPRSVYGKIVAEADRVIEPPSIIRRTIQFGLTHYPELDKEGMWQRTLKHLHEKYGEGGYLRLWIPESNNGRRLEELRGIIRDEERLRVYFEEIYNDLIQ